MNSAYVSSLAAKHADLEARIGSEESRPRPDVQLIARLKKLKLQLKEAISSN